MSHSLPPILETWLHPLTLAEFFDRYWKLIYEVALRSGLTESEAQDVVQELGGKTVEGAREQRRGLQA